MANPDCVKRGLPGECLFQLFSLFICTALNDLREALGNSAYVGGNLLEFTQSGEFHKEEDDAFGLRRNATDVRRIEIQLILEY